MNFVLQKAPDAGSSGLLMSLVGLVLIALSLRSILKRRRLARDAQIKREMIYQFNMWIIGNFGGIVDITLDSEVDDTGHILEWSATFRPRQDLPPRYWKMFRATIRKGRDNGYFKRSSIRQETRDPGQPDS